MEDIKQKYSIFPSEFESLAQKKTDEYGTQYFDAIYQAWYLNFPANNPDRQKYILNRKFAEGYESIEEEKSLLGLNGDLSYVTLDYRPINRIATLVDNMVGKMTNQLYKIQCNPLDTLSKTKQDEERARIRAMMALKAVEPMISGKTGIPLVPQGELIPEDSDELDLHMKMNFKTDDAMSIELAIRSVFNDNDVDLISIPQMVRDIIVDKRTALMCRCRKDGRIFAQRQDLIDVILPYSKSDRYDNCRYCMILHKYTIQQISEMTDKFSEEDLYNIARQYEGKNDNPQFTWGTSYEGYYNSSVFSPTRPYNNFFITVGEGYFLSTVSEKSGLAKHKKSKTGKVKYFKGEPPKDYEEVEVATKFTVKRFEGMYIPNSKYIWNYKMSEWVDGETAKIPLIIIAPNIYDMQNKSLVERMIPFEKALNLAHLKFQQFLIKAKPPGLAINLRGLDKVVKGLGKDGKIKPTEITKLYDQTGSFIFYDYDENTGQPINMPFKELEGGISMAFRNLIEVHNHYINLMNQVIGFNNVVDASSPDKEALVGVNKMAAQATYDCMRPIKMAVIDVLNRGAKTVAQMAQDCIKFGNDEFFLTSIGEGAVNTIKEGADTPIASFGISVDEMPDDAEMASLEQLIQIGLGSQPPALLPSDATRVRQQMKTDVKLAGELLALLERKNIKDRAKQSAALQQQNGQIQVQSAQAASQAKQQEMQLQLQVEAQLEKIRTDNKLIIINAEAHSALELQKLKNEGIYTQAEINSGAKRDVQEAMNKGKLENTLVSEHLKHQSKSELAEPIKQE